MDSTPRIQFIMGCTGSGKGEVGRELAHRVGAEIISVDSMKIYRRMNIGTAKPSFEMTRRVPHHLIDIVEPATEFSVADFVRHAEDAIPQIAHRGKGILAIGGTGLYIKALSEGLFDGPSADPILRQSIQQRARDEGSEALHAELVRVDPQAGLRIHRNDLRRIVRALEVYQLTGQPITQLQTQWDRERTRHPCRFIGIRRSIEDQNHRTNMRVRRLIDAGWVDEVKNILAEPAPLSTSAAQALGYPEIIQHVRGKLALEEAAEKIKIATRQFAKSQRTWFKRFRSTTWYDLEPDETVESIVNRILADWPI